MNQTDPGICQVFLDNLHDQYGEDITSYNCNASPTGQRNVTFVVPVTCQDSSIQSAIWLASKPTIGGVGCSWPDSEGLEDREGWETLLDLVFDGAGAVLGG